MLFPASGRRGRLLAGALLHPCAASQPLLVSRSGFGWAAPRSALSSGRLERPWWGPPRTPVVGDLNALHGFSPRGRVQLLMVLQSGGIVPNAAARPRLAFASLARSACANLTQDSCRLHALGVVGDGPIFIYVSHFVCISLCHHKRTYISTSGPVWRPGRRSLWRTAAYSHALFCGVGNTSPAE